MRQFTSNRRAALKGFAWRTSWTKDISSVASFVPSSGPSQLQTISPQGSMTWLCPTPSGWGCPASDHISLRFDSTSTE